MSEEEGVVKEETPEAEATPDEQPDKSDDKQEIEEEEKEKMITEEEEGGGGEEVKRIKGGEVEKKKKALEEAAMEGTKRRIPIGGIKIPGFLRPKSRDKPTKEGEGDIEEGTDLLEVANPQPEEVKDQENQPSSRFARLGLNKIKISNPFARFTKDSRGSGSEEVADGEEHQKKPSGARLLNAVKLPLASVLPKLRPTKETEVDQSDPNQQNNMENINLETNQVDAEKAALEEESESKWANRDWRFYTKRFYEFRYPITGIIVLFVLLVIVISIAFSGPSVPTHAPIVDGKYISAVTLCGPVEGIMEKGVFVFRGIPYALPPLGHLRWARPQPFQLSDCWNSTYKAHNYSQPCLHINKNNSIEGSEDCLYLDVYTPHVRYDSPLPVVVIFGAYNLGGPMNSLEPSLSIPSTKDVVFVRPMIRLSSLGFLPVEVISKSTYPRTSGNYGLHDMVAALNWVRLNAQHFGGDHKSVTVLAHRAASTLVAALTTSLKVENLFARAWLASPSAVYPNKTLLESERASEGYLKTLKCSETPTAECLRSQEATDLVEAVPKEWRKISWDLPTSKNEENHQWLVLDGLIIRENPNEIWNSRNITVQVILGTTKHSEWNHHHSDWNETVVIGHLKKSLLGEAGLVDEVISRYNSTIQGLSAAISDIRTVCPSFLLHKIIKNSRFYLVTQGRGDQQAADSDIDFEAILGQFKAKTPQERKYVSTIQSMFYQFVSNGVLPKHKMSYLAQDSSPFKELPNCDFWQSSNFTKYARAD